MRRKLFGKAAIQAEMQKKEEINRKAKEISEQYFKNMQSSMNELTENIKRYSVKYRDEIRYNPDFRQKFAKLCLSTGVDPLASNRGVWSKYFGIGEFYYELTIQLIEICLATEEKYKGFIPMNDLIKLLSNVRKDQKIEITLHDVTIVLDKLKLFGNRYKLVKCDILYLQTIPAELSTDHIHVLNFIKSEKYVTIESSMKKFDWNRVKIEECLVI
ncbi:ESCRT-II complex subunit VPS22 [Intoshia linei]|uniref:Vacuolar-sorting protein SNF8 n=1 Tax=Intoshia linei TaxID=1819745 RepID=A0A177BAH8_9BILA|nr:ESCRT-II complex subunit VPS22 [Intoshia linei]